MGVAGQIHPGHDAVDLQPGGLVEPDHGRDVVGEEDREDRLLARHQGGREVAHGAVPAAEGVEPGDARPDVVERRAGLVALDEEDLVLVDGVDAANVRRGRVARNQGVPSTWAIRRPSSARDRMPSLR
jgi:hypothetical protein